MKIFKPVNTRPSPREGKVVDCDSVLHIVEPQNNNVYLAKDVTSIDFILI